MQAGDVVMIAATNGPTVDEMLAAIPDGSLAFGDVWPPVEVELIPGEREE